VEVWVNERDLLKSSSRKATKNILESFDAICDMLEFQESQHFPEEEARLLGDHKAFFCYQLNMIMV
jgi:hypothetical protein